MNFKFLITLLIIPGFTFAEPAILRCPNPSEITVTTQKQLYGTFVQWKANVNSIPFSNNNAHATGPIELVSVRLYGQAINCVYMTNEGSVISQISQISNVSMTNFGDTGKKSHYVNGEKNVCSYGGGYCCNVSKSSDCSFIFDN